MSITLGIQWWSYDGNEISAAHTHSTLKSEKIEILGSCTVWGNHAHAPTCTYIFCANLLLSEHCAAVVEIHSKLKAQTSSAY